MPIFPFILFPNFDYIHFNMRNQFLLLGVLLCLLSCVSSDKTKGVEKYQNGESYHIPDSVFANHTIKYLSLAPSWEITQDNLLLHQSSNARKLTQIPSKLCMLKKLEILNLSSHDIKALPDCFFELNNLKELDLSFNEHFDIKPFLEKLPRLKNLKKLNLLGIASAWEDTMYVQSKIDATKVKLMLTRRDYQVQNH